jgi:hypothetical protein
MCLLSWPSYENGDEEEEKEAGFNYHHCPGIRPGSGRRIGSCGTESSAARLYLHPLNIFENP